jgi:hypothetical protein
MTIHQDDQQRRKIWVRVSVFECRTGRMVGRFYRSTCPGENPIHVQRFVQRRLIAVSLAIYVD